MRVGLWPGLRHAAAAAARVQEKQRHPEDLALKHTRRLTHTVRCRIQDLQQFLPRPAQKLGMHFAGASQFSSSNLPTPFSRSQGPVCVSSHCYPSTPGLARVLEVREGEWGSEELLEPNEAWLIKGRAQAIQKTRRGRKRCWALLLMHISTQDAQFSPRVSTRWTDRTGQASRRASVATSELKPRQKQTQHDRRAPALHCSIATLPQGIGARGFLDPGDLQAGTPYRGRALGGGEWPGPIGE